MVFTANDVRDPHQRVVDNDGKVDAFLVNLGAKGTLVHNVSPNTGHWLAIRLTGTKSNRDGIGAVVQVTAGTQKQSQLVKTGSSYLSQSELPLTFGLGAAKGPLEVRVTWPGGAVDVVQVPAANVQVTIRQGAGAVESTPLPRGR